MRYFSWLGFVTICITLSACGSPNSELSPDLKTSATTIKAVYFGGPEGTYTKDRWRADWDNPGWEDGFSEANVSVVPHGDYYKLQVRHPEGSVGSGTRWVYEFPSRNVVTLDYKVKFRNDFDFVKGGKLPGLCGDECDRGGMRTDNGWSTRVMWLENGKAVSYVYRGDKQSSNGRYGENIQWKWPTSGRDVHFERDRTYDVKQTVTMNTPGQSDGKLEVWLDGVKVLTTANINWNKSGTAQIDKFLMYTFFGGSESDWAPKKDEYLWLDNFIISTP